ncbi:MAG: hypothetical protein O9341_11260, partial [Paucibacter sp.]|nr:hypothetical protein [Roseateles sp.]
VNSIGALNLGTGTVGGNLVAASNGGAITQAAGGLSVGGNSNLQAGAAAITLTESSNNFSGAVSLSNTGANHIQLTDTNALALGTLNVATGNLTVNSTGALNLGTGTVGGNLVAASNGGAITQASGGLTVGGSSNIQAGAAAITLTENANSFGGAVSLNTSGSAAAAIKSSSLNLATSTVGGALTAIASSGGISQTGAITTGATGSSFSVLTAGQSIDLSTQANSLAGLVNGSDVFNTQGNLGLRNLAGIQLGSTTVSGNLVLSSDTGAISQTGAFNVGADGSSFTTSAAGQDVTLSLANAFNGKTVAIHSGADASLTAEALKFASSSIAGKLVATASSGSITQTGALTLGADGSSFSTAAGQAITLNSANVLNGKTIALNSGADASISADTLKFATSSIAGKLTATASTGAITQTGALTLGADGNSFSTAAGQAITLNSANVLNGKTVALNSGADASITADTLKFAASTISGKLVATASSGSISQTGALNLGADGNSFSTAAGQAITLGSANVLNSKTVALNSGGDAAITADTLKFAASTISGKLVATSNSGSITQTGVLNLGADGNSFSSAQAITLNSANLFNGKTVALASSADTSITADALKFAASTIAGKLIATASTGTITQSGALNLGADGSSFSTAAGQAITLNSANVFNGKTVALSSGADANIAADALKFAASTVNGKLLATSSSGGISQTGALNLGADGNVFQSAQGVTLASANLFNGKTVAFISGSDASITADALKFASSTIGGKLVATASAGAITQTGGLNLGADGNSFTSSAGQAISLTGANVLNGKTVAIHSGASASISADALKFAVSTVSGDFTATATSGAISQSGALSIAGTSHLNAGSHAINLSQANDFQGLVHLAGGDTQVRDINSLALATAQVGN